MSPTGRVLLSSEGVGTDVVEIVVPRSMTAAQPEASPSPSASPSPATSDPAPRARSRDDRPVAFVLRVAAGLVLLGALGVGLRRLWRSDRG